MNPLTLSSSTGFITRGTSCNIRATKGAQWETLPKGMKIQQRWLSGVSRMEEDYSSTMVPSVHAFALFTIYIAVLSDCNHHLLWRPHAAWATRLLRRELLCQCLAQPGNTSVHPAHQQQKVASSGKTRTIQTRSHARL